MFVLNDKERLELKDVMVNMALIDIGFMMCDVKNIEEDRNNRWRVYLPTFLKKWGNLKINQTQQGVAQKKLVNGKVEIF